MRVLLDFLQAGIKETLTTALTSYRTCVIVLDQSQECGKALFGMTMVSSPGSSLGTGLLEEHSGQDMTNSEKKISTDFKYKRIPENKTAYIKLRHIFKAPNSHKMETRSKGQPRGNTGDHLIKDKNLVLF